MKEYTLNIAGLQRKLPFVDPSDTLAYASFVIISDTELIQSIAPLIAQQIADCEIILTAEAKGIALAYEISKILHHPCFAVARKSIKSYMKDPVFVDMKSITTTTPQRLYLDSDDMGKLKCRKVCLLDDVVSTGGSLIALKMLCEKAGGISIANACILAEGEAADRRDLIYLQKLPLFHKLPNGEYEEKP